MSNEQHGRDERRDTRAHVDRSGISGTVACVGAAGLGGPSSATTGAHGSAACGAATAAGGPRRKATRTGACEYPLTRSWSRGPGSESVPGDAADSLTRGGCHEIVGGGRVRSRWQETRASGGPHQVTCTPGASSRADDRLREAQGACECQAETAARADRVEAAVEEDPRLGLSRRPLPAQMGKDGPS